MFGYVRRSNFAERLKLSQREYIEALAAVAVTDEISRHEYISSEYLMKYLGMKIRLNISV